MQKPITQDPYYNKINFCDVIQSECQICDEPFVNVVDTEVYYNWM